MASKYHRRKAMKKLFIVVEGETEERFLRTVIYPHFISLGIHIEAQSWITNRKLGTSGGGSSFDLIENHLRRLMSRYKNDDNVFFSIMIDLYKFPRQGNTIYDADLSGVNTGKDKALLLQRKMSIRFSNRSFIPYVQLHEFEALLLSKPAEFGVFYTDKKKEIQALIKEIKGLAPEEINETPEGAPSKRIIKHIPTYKHQKTSAGVITAERIGLEHLRTTCNHFNDWIVKLEAI